MNGTYKSATQQAMSSEQKAGLKKFLLFLS